MKSSKYVLSLGLVFVGLITTAPTNSAQASQYDSAAIMAVEKENRSKHITLTSLHFCPKWYEALYCGREYKLMNQNARLVLKMTGDGEAILNPEHEPFGWSHDTIDLKKIDVATVKDSLAGRPNTDGGLTCDLITELGSPEMEIFHLDMKFANSGISSYRLRGSGISKPGWVTLNATNSADR